MQAMQLAVVFLAQGTDMLANGINVGFQGRLPGRFVVLNDPTLVGHQGHLGINNQIATIRQVHHHVGPQQLPVAVAVAALGVVFDALAQTGTLQYPLQNQLAPVALNFLVTFESAGQIGSFFGDLPVQLLQGLDLAAQRLAVPGFCRVDIFHPLSEILQLVPERV